MREFHNPLALVLFSILAICGFEYRVKQFRGWLKSEDSPKGERDPWER